MKRLRMVSALMGMAICLLVTSFAVGEDAKPKPRHSFLKNVKVTMTEAHMVVESNGIPNHKTGNFPSRDNPNRIRKQSYRFVIPLKPQKAERPTRLPMGPIGVAINGIPFYNPYNAHGQNAVEGPTAEVFDSCCGHPDPMGRYHYHKYPTCIKSPFSDEPGKHSPIIGYAFDGFPIYGPQDKDGKPPTDLDGCNGHSDSVRGYHYHVTAKFPYILGAYRGVVERSNIERRGPGGSGRPPRFPPPPPRGPGRRPPRIGPGGRPGFPPPPPPGRRPPRPNGFTLVEEPEDALMKAMDLDKDGELSEKEIRQSATTLLKLDKNKDKRLVRKEWQPRGPKLNPPSRLIRALDADGDAILSATEIRLAPRLLRRLDRNRDKKISKKEWQLPKPKGSI